MCKLMQGTRDEKNAKRDGRQGQHLGQVSDKFGVCAPRDGASVKYGIGARDLGPDRTRKSTEYEQKFDS